jgi:hypothetical protein
MKFQKKNFLLIEILVAITLIALCSFTLMENPIRFFSHEIKTLEKIEFERIADLSFLEIKERLYKNEISWDMASTQKKAKIETLKDFDLKIGSFEKKITRSYQVWTRREKESFKGDIYRALLVYIYLDSKSFKEVYKYRVFAQKISLDAKAQAVTQ